ncbi:unnamed protein product [Parascedosporium putredinis]|uniref:AB hydrolase-1 domain-containing protein n=1 Tax=Parascedosporium putredinis TaxID=1442378 RepID=A0A9P1GVU3_9PEZI|nr:unnamed protein product [Parascedosporium putredinis]CAI7988278.1 unnamed protein product [Parascedosporium putredinis]
MKSQRLLQAAARGVRPRRQQQAPLTSLTAPHTTTRSLSSQPVRRGAAATAAAASPANPGVASNPAMAFPCLDKIESRSANLEATSRASGPEPSYTSGETLKYHCSEPLLLDWGGVLPEFDIAYETWGEINADKSNVILLHTGLSASSHAHSTPANPMPGWWEKFIGPGLSLDTDKYHVICTNVIGGCYGSTGPGSIDPADGHNYATRFPILTMEDMVRAQFRLLDGLGVAKLYASVGSSMGGMQSLAAGVLFPDRVARVVTVSGCARSHPYSIAMRHTQRQVLMMDPNWNRGFYYGRQTPALCPDFLIETYLDYAGEKFCLTYDPNSLLYVSKAMDLFDLGAENQATTRDRRAAPPELPAPDDLIRGLANLREIPTLVMGVASDILFPAWQQREIADALRLAGNQSVTHHELNEEASMFGHDTFLLDLKVIGANLKKFLG